MFTSGGAIAALLLFWLWLACWGWLLFTPDPTHHYTGQLRMYHICNLPLSGRTQFAQVRGKLNGKHYRIKVTQGWLQGVHDD